MLKLAETDSEFSKTPAATDAPVQSYEEAQRHKGTRYESAPFGREVALVQIHHSI